MGFPVEVMRSLIMSFITNLLSSCLNAAVVRWASCAEFPDAQQPATNHQPPLVLPSTACVGGSSAPTGLLNRLDGHAVQFPQLPLLRIPWGTIFIRYANLRSSP